MGLEKNEHELTKVKLFTKIVTYFVRTANRLLF